MKEPGGDRVVYVDNAATSWPKPPVVADAMAAFLNECGANPGRSGHRLALEAGRLVYRAREAVAASLGVADPLRVSFMHNATAALNTALAGFLRPGDRAVADGNAHNALARPLTELVRRGVRVDWAPCSGDGRLDLDRLEALAKGARMLAITHGSNVSGALAPLNELAGIAARKGAFLLIDAAQTAGGFDLGLDGLGNAALAFTGHKAMLGPGGTGGLAFGAKADIEAFSPLLRGGTGSKSEFEEQPSFMPDRFEAGTHNGPGLAGLLAGLSWIEGRGRKRLRDHEAGLTKRLIEGLSILPGVRVYGPPSGAERCPVVSFSSEALNPSEAALELDERYGILCRVGLHCAPRAHKSLGSFPGGSVRLAPGPFTTLDDIEYILASLAETLARARKAGGTGGRA
jgi:cysteine desulfurase / selenocysteine lyase